MTLSEELKWRGFVNQTTLAKLSDLDNKKWIFYHGYDASADSLTVGNLAAIMLDKVFIRHGHKPILLAGGATSLIGDPGGKDTERTLQSETDIAKNVAAVKKQIERLFGGQIHLLNNLDWFKSMPVLDFLRDTGKHFSMTPLVQRDYISKRMGKEGAGISYTEFSYTLLQGYDFLHLHKKHGVTMQLAGADQWGNSLSGVELVRKVTGDEVHVLTMPLILDRKTGKKFGKSEAGAVWLDEAKTSSSDFYQFWVNTSDEAVGDYLKIFTELDMHEIGELMQDFEKRKTERSAQHRLANEVTKFVHGKSKADEAATYARSIADNLTSKVRSNGSVSVGDNIADLLVKHNLAGSKTEARRLMENKGVYINNIQASHSVLREDDFKNGLLMLRRGKSKSNTVILKQK